MTPSGGRLPDPAFWAGRRVLVTGHTGFKGSWLTAWLQGLGATVMGVALPGAPTAPSLWDQLALDGVEDLRADIAGDAWQEAVRRFSPEVVLHLAAQSLVSVGHAEPARTFEANVLGTVRVLDALDGLGDLVAALIITTDKVYEPSQPPPHSEAHHLGGADPYSASKAAAEIAVRAWPRLVAPCATARAGNVIGGGDWAAHRLLPDLVRAWSGRVPVVLRNPFGVRPWQHVLEPLRGYLLYAEALASGAPVPSALNFGPAESQSVPVGELVRFAADQWQRLGGDLPEPRWTESREVQFNETAELTLDSSLAAHELGWASVFSWRDAVAMTLEWYAGVLAGTSAATLVRAQLDSYGAHLGAFR